MLICSEHIINCCRSVGRYLRDTQFNTAKEAAKSMKTEKDLSDFSRMLKNAEDSSCAMVLQAKEIPDCF